jgi:hypothetical protein
MTTRNIYDLAQTWNDGATTFTAIKMNVTDTASNAASLLLDLQVDGASKESTDKSGNKTLVGNLLLNATKFVHAGGQAQHGFANANVPYIKNTSTDFRLNTDGSIGIGASLRLYSPSNHVFEQRSGANAQAFNIYNTYTDASNYERGFMKWSGNVFEIGAEAAGAGSLRNMKIGFGSAQLLLGAVATQIMQVGIGGIVVSKPIYFSATDAHDIGSATLAPRDIYAGRDIFCTPSSSLTPTNNGDLCIEATNNTTLTFKLKGSDGTVRSGTVTLA